MTQAQDKGKVGGMYMNHTAKKNFKRAEEKQRNRESYKKSGTNVKVIVENKMEIVEAENNSLCTHICSMNCAMIVKCSRLKQ